MSTESIKYSGLRDNVLGKLQKIEKVPVTFRDVNTELVDALDVRGLFFAQVLDFQDKTKLYHLFDRLSKENEGVVTGAFNDDVLAVAWICMKGIVDSTGCPFFTEEDIVKFSGKYISLAYDLAQSVCEVNDITSKAKQATVGNLEGTDQPENSSEQPLVSERLLEG